MEFQPPGVCSKRVCLFDQSGDANYRNYLNYQGPNKKILCQLLMLKRKMSQVLVVSLCCCNGVQQGLSVAVMECSKGFVFALKGQIDFNFKMLRLGRYLLLMYQATCFIGFILTSILS